MRLIVTDRVEWSVGLSVGLSQYEPCKSGRTDRDAVWVVGSGGLKEPCIRWGPDPPHGNGRLLRGKGRPIVKYRDFPPGAVQKRLNRSRWGLECRVARTQRTTY